MKGKRYTEQQIISILKEREAGLKVTDPGDMLVFRGDQRHSYHNLDTKRISVAISVVCFAPFSQ
ncbi:MAG: hypothetical protein IIC61_04765 [Proteobacteria bacterium]|nr:hypothetical protein [Pseudomonadota bacterium]TDJ33107.1 MAG: hypothetical protein E2O53_10835 [Gammaproteobacteria bacterium]